MNQVEVNVAAADSQNPPGLRGLLADRVIGLQIDVRVRVFRCIPLPHPNFACISRKYKADLRSQTSA